MTDISVDLNYKSFYLRIFLLLQLLYEHPYYLGTSFYSSLLARKSVWWYCGGRVKLKFCGVGSAVVLLSASPHFLFVIYYK